MRFRVLFCVLVVAAVVSGAWARKFKPSQALLEELEKVKRDSECNKKADDCFKCATHGLTNPSQKGMQVETFKWKRFEGCYWDPSAIGNKKCRMKKVAADVPPGAFYLDPNICLTTPDNTNRKDSKSKVVGRFRPIRPGVSVSQLHDAGPGTLTAVIKGKTKLYILTNAHVLYRKQHVCNFGGCPLIEPETVAYDYVTQPGGFDGGRMDTDVIGKVVLTKHGNYKYQNKDVGLDIALVELCTGDGTPFPLCRKAIEATNYLPVIQGEGEESFIMGGTGEAAAKDTDVEKIGAMSGKSAGKIKKADYGFDKAVRQGANKDRFDNQLLGCGIGQTPGDSGGPLFTGDTKSGAKLVGVNHGMKSEGDCNVDNPSNRDESGCCVISSPFKAVLDFLDNSDDNSINGQSPFKVAASEKATHIDATRSTMNTVSNKLEHIFHYKFATPKELTTAFVREHVAHEDPPAQCPPPKEDDEDPDRKKFAKAGFITHGMQHTTEAKRQVDNHDVMHYCTYNGLKDGDTSTKWKFKQNYQYRDNDGSWKNAAPSFTIQRWGKREGNKLTAFVSKKADDDSLSHETKLEFPDYFK